MYLRKYHNLDVKEQGHLWVGFCSMTCHHFLATQPGGRSEHVRITLPDKCFATALTQALRSSYRSSEEGQLEKVIYI